MKFEKIIQKHSNTYTFTTTSEGYFDGPNWVEGTPTETDIICAIFPVTAEDVQKYEGLGYTTQDIKIFIPASELSVELQEGDSLTYKSNDYELDTKMDRTTHADFIKWFAKRVENQ